jgi:DNA (cytosine-5)-methyltransferase 1
VDIGEWVDSKGKKHKDADSPKYKALGNGIACPFWYQLLSNITEELRNSDNEVREQYTQGSLFSGIGSFDLLWDKINGNGASKWSSDIEEFPIAVMKYHFGDEDDGIEGDLDNYLKGADIVEGETING